jgi:dUTP pyrophosphatase
MPINVKVKYFTDIEPIEQINGGDWIDLRAAEDVFMESGDFKLIPLGVAMQLPKDYEAHVVPRSSTYKKWHIIQANHMGVIDNSYCGDDDQWMFPAIALEDTMIHKNDRICQFRIVKNQPKINFTQVETLDNKNRGGFGSIGSN